MNKFIILILILEILKKIIVNNYYLKNIFLSLQKLTMIKRNYLIGCIIYFYFYQFYH